MAPRAQPGDLARRVTGDVQTESRDVAPSAVASIASDIVRAEVDMQIATAKRFPRSVAAVIRQIETLATLDQETADECWYELPRDGKKIIGPSIRFAEIVMQAWGNCRVGARITNEGKTHLEATGVYHDLETNMAVQRSIAVRITKSDGKRYGDDMIGTASAAGTSKALRNAILAGVPKGVWNKGFAAARAVSRGDAATLGERRRTVIGQFKELGIGHAELFEVLDVKGEADVTLDVMLTLRGLYSAVSSGESSWADILSEARAARAPAQLAEKTAQASPAAAAGAEQAREGFSREHVARETGEDQVLSYKGKAGPEHHKPAPEFIPINAETGEVIKGEVTSGAGGEVNRDAASATPGGGANDPGDLTLDFQKGGSGPSAPTSASRSDVEDLQRAISAGGAPLPQSDASAPSADAKDETRGSAGGASSGSAAKTSGPAASSSTPGGSSPETAAISRHTASGQSVEQAESRAEPQPPPGTFSKFWDAVRASTEWTAVKKLLTPLYRSDDWQALDAEEQAALRRKVWGHVTTAKFGIDQVQDPTAFYLWMDTQVGAAGADAIEGNLRVLKREAAFERMPPESQKTFEAGVVAKMEALRGAR